MKVRIADITEDSVVDGPGLRTVVWFAGCNHKCPECHNPNLWDFNSGNEVDTDDVIEKIKDSKRITFSGGDPLYQLEALDEIVGKLNHDKDIWIYTGFLLNEFNEMLATTKYLQNRDFVVKCGPYIKTLRDASKLYRGSSNQRIYKYIAGTSTIKDISNEIDGGDSIE